MNRRHFMVSLGTTLGAAGAAAKTKARITKITLATVQGRFHKFVAMNSYDKAPKGHTYTNTLVRIATDQDVEGVGVMAYALPDKAFHAALRQLVGRDPATLYQFQDSRITDRADSHRELLARYKHLDGPLFDLIGKLRGVPCWKLMGEAVRDKTELYDGTLYFSDIWFRDRGARAVVEEVLEAQKMGYPAVKIKVGRGSKWMEAEEGLRRDIEVLRAVREAVGPKLKINADANNGYRGDYDRAWRLLEGSKAADLHFIEELFPEDVGLYTKLRGQMKQAGMGTIVADGENFPEAGSFDPYLKPRRLMDIVQLDIRRGGFIEAMDMARKAEAAGAVSIPHNWGSQVGLFMGLHAAKAIKAVSGAEDDRSTCDAVIAKGYEYSNGTYTTSDEPGLGIHVNEDVYREKYQAGETVISASIFQSNNEPEMGLS